VWTASGACAIFGIGVGVSEGIRESYYASVTAVAVLLLASACWSPQEATSA
jgi:hypothetical protein